VNAPLSIVAGALAQDSKPAVTTLADHGGVLLELSEFVELVTSITDERDLHPETVVSDCMDSLHVLEIACAIEQTTGVTVDEMRDLDPNMTLRDLYLKYLEFANSPVREARS
jgi:hypothetical protein